MIRICSRVFFVVSALIVALTLSSCKTKNEDGAAYRIVGLNGQARQVKTRVPELNARILESQGKAPTSAPSLPQTEVAQNSPSPNSIQNSSTQNPQAYNFQGQNQQIIPAQSNGFSASNTDAIRNTLQSETAPNYNLPKSDSANAGLANNANFANKKDAVVSAGDVENKDQEIQLDLSESKQDAASAGKKMKLKVGATALQRDEELLKEEESAKEKVRGIFVQTGSFSSEENAKHALKASQKFYKGRIEEAGSEDKKIYRVLLGPFVNDKKAKEVVHKIKAAGRDAIVVKNK